MLKVPKTMADIICSRSEKAKERKEEEIKFTMRLFIEEEKKEKEKVPSYARI